jgi:hypothetical protein
MEISPDRTGIRPRHYRSAVSNGSRLHVEADARTAWARRFRDVFYEIIADIPGEVTASQRQTARRAALLCIEAERLEGIAAGGQQIDYESYGRLTDRLNRAFRRLGIAPPEPEPPPEPPTEEDRLVEAYARLAGEGMKR